MNSSVDKDPGFPYRQCIKVGTFESPAHHINLPQEEPRARQAQLGQYTCLFQTLVAQLVKNPPAIQERRPWFDSWVRKNP